MRLGGGSNHRFGLDDAVLIKDNHLIAGGGIQAAVARARAGLGHMVKIEVEVDTLAQLEELIPLGVDAVLLDNMPPETLSRAVRMVDGRMLTEASGNINARTVRAVAETGVDMISVGWLTHVTNFDVGWISTDSAGCKPLGSAFARWRRPAFFSTVTVTSAAWPPVPARRLPPARHPMQDRPT